MAKYLPICGKNSSNNATPIGATNDGEIKTVHIWESTIKDVCYNQEIRDTNVHTYPANGTMIVDVSAYAITSLRIHNGLNQPCKIKFYGDNLNTLAGKYLADINGNPFSFEIPNGSSSIVLSSDDFPQLNFLQGIRIAVSCDTAPTSGSFACYVHCKR